MNRLSAAKRIAVVSALVEGSSLRSTVRMTGVGLNTIQRLMADLGPVCRQVQSDMFQGLPCKHLQADEMWGFVGCKQANVKPGAIDRGDIWLWSVICRDCKLVPTWAVGPRELWVARALMNDLTDRLANHVQLSTDGLRMYVDAIENAFGSEASRAVLQKLYGGEDAEARGLTPERRYSPAHVSGTIRERSLGNPDMDALCTSHVERMNGTTRTFMKRFARLTYAFSKRLANLRRSTDLHFAAYNLVKIHRSLRVTPAMEAGVTDRLWTVGDLVALLERAETEVSAA